MFARKKKIFSRKTKNKVERDLRIRDIFAPAAMSLGLFLAPWNYGVAEAENPVSGIVRDGGTGREGIEQIGNNAVKVYAGQANSSVAINRFSQFNVKNGEVANMMFRTSNGTTDSANLVNFVNDQINISGTVNALRNNKIDGNIYFLSKSGMVVSATGAINAGSLTAVGGFAYPSAGKAAEVANSIIDNPGNLMKMDGDKTGTDIKIFGRINAPGGVRLISNTNIEVGGDDNSASNKAVINTTMPAAGTVDFGSIVNTTGVSTPQNLEFGTATNGNVVLLATAMTPNTREGAGKLEGAVKDTSKATITINNHADITASGTVDIKVEAANNVLFGNFGTFGSAGGAVATVTVNGNITAGNQLLIGANATYDYEAGVWESMTNNAKEAIIDNIERLLGNEFISADLGLVGSNAEAKINIGNNAHLTANGSDSYKTESDGTKSLVNRALSIKANATNVTASDTVYADSGSSESKRRAFAAIGVLYQYSTTEANVNIGQEAELKATKAATGSAEAGGVAIASTATAKSSGETLIRKDPGAQSTDMAGIAIMIAKNDTDNKITIGNGAQIEGNSVVDIKATTSSTSGFKATVKDNDSTDINTALVYADMDSKAQININGNLTATAGAVNVAAMEDSKVTVKATNSETPVTIDTITTYMTDGPGILASKAVDKIFGLFKKNSVDDNPAWKETDIPNSLFTAGAAAAIADGKSEGTINIGNTSQINGYNGIKMDAQSLLNGMTLGATSAVKADNESGIGVSAGVLVSKLENKAAINIAGNAVAGSAASLTSENGAIKLNTLTKYEWNRTKDMVKAVKDSWAAFVTLVDEEDQDLKTALSDLEGKENPSSEDLSKAAKKFSEADLGAIFMKYSQYAPEKVAALAKLITSMEAFLNAANYVDVNVGAVAKGGSQVQKAEVAGSVAVTQFVKNSEIKIGQNVKLNAKDDIEMLSKTVQKDVDFYGNLTGTIQAFNKVNTGYGQVILKAGVNPTFIPDISQGGDTVVGGNVGYDKNATNSLVQIDNGVELTGNNIKLDTENDVQHVAFALGGGSASSSGITGMAAVSSGESKSIVQVDNSAMLTAKAAAPTEADKYNVSLNAKNDTSVVLMTGDYTSGQKAGIGVSIAVATFDVITKAEIGNFINITKNMGYIDANSIMANAFTDGTINTITIAGGVAGGSPKPEPKAKVGNNQQDGGEKKELKDVVINAEGQGAAGGANNGNNVNLVKDGEGNAQAQGAAAAQQNADNNSKVALAGAGSISWNSVVNETIAGIDGIHIGKSSVAENSTLVPGTLDTNAAKLHVTAGDDSYIGAYSGAMALTLMGKDNQAEFTGTLAGAVAVNDLKKTTKAHINNTANSKATINATDLSNKAINKGEQVAAGLSLGIQRKEGAGANIAASASINLINSTVAAEIQNNNINKNTSTAGGSVANIAYDKDLQIAGGITAQYTKTSLGVGAAVTVNKVVNNISALMSGNDIGSATNYSANVDNLAVSKLTQVGTAVSIGISNSEKNIGTANAAVAANVVSNDVAATISSSNIYTGTVASEAKDGNLGADSETYTARVNELAGYGFDVDGSEAKATANNNDQGYKDSSTEDGELSTESTDDVKKIKYTYQKAKVDNSGNLIVGTAAAVSIAGKSNAGLGAGVVYNKVNNDFTASYSGGSIYTNQAATAEGAAPNVNINAESDTLMVGVAAGVAAHTTKPGASVAGSVVVQNIDNDTLATLENVDVQANKVNVKADTSSSLTSVAGLASVSLGGNGAAIGMTWAQNDLANTTGAYVRGLELVGSGTASVAYNPDLNVNAVNTSTAWAVGLGASVGQGDYSAALTGAYASNNGDNNTEAIVDKYGNKRSSITKAGKIAASATDNTKLKALAGDIAVSVSGEVGLALGGAVVTNNVGSDSNRQQIKAQINNTDIDAVEGTEVAVNATNASGLLSVAVGGAVAVDTSEFSAAISAQGSVAVSNIYTSTDASMANSNVKGYGTSDTEKAGNNDEAKVTVQADNSVNVVNTADGLAVGAGVGLVNIGAVMGIAKTNSYADTYAGISGAVANNQSQYSVKNLAVLATAANKVTDVGFSASAGITSEGLGVAIIANISNNTINNTTTAELKNISATALENVAVQASSQEVLKNYSGSLNVAVVYGSSIGIGATVANNDILGSTSALITDSAITAVGSAYAEGSNTGIAVDQYTLNTDQASDDYGTTAQKYTDEAKTQKPVKKGLVVTADAHHDMTNISITAGVGGASAGALAVEATVATNTVGGENAATKAVITNSSINSDLDKNQLNTADIYVAANDLSDVSNHVGTLSVAGAGIIGLDFGVAVENNSLTRGVEAAIINEANAKKSLEAFNLDVQALNASKLLASVSGLGVAAGGTVEFAGTGVASIDRFTNKTLAEIKGMDILAHSLTIDAEKINKSSKYTNAAAASVGEFAISTSIGVSLLDDTSSTDAKLLESNVKTYKAADDDQQDNVTVEAHNNANVRAEVGDTSVAIGLGGALGLTIGANDIKSTVSAEVSRSKVGTADAKTHDITIDAANNLKANTTNYVISGGLVDIGVGVGVNTINTGTAVRVSSSELYAEHDIKINAEEKRKLVEYTAGANIGAGVISTNVMVNNIGTALADTIDYENGNGTIDKASGNKYSTAAIKTAVNDAIAKQNNVLAKQQKDSGLNSWSAGTVAAPGVQTVVEGTAANKAKLAAGNALTISNLEHNDIDTTVISGSFGGAVINVAVGNTSVKDELGLNINNADLTGKNIAVTSLIDGTIDNLAEQASGSAAEINVGVGKATHNGSNQINIAGSSFTALGKDLANTNTDYNVTITAGNEAVVKNTVQAATVSGVAGGGLHGVAKDAVNVGINIGAGTMNNDGSIKSTTAGSENTLLGSGTVDIKAYSNPEVYSKALAASVTIATGAGTIADAHAEGSAKMNVFAGNTFDTKALSLNTYTGVDSDNTNDTAKTTTTKADVIGTFVSAGSVVVNKARTYNEMQAVTNVEANTYQNTVVSTNTLKYVPVMENGAQAYTTKADGVVYTLSSDIDEETGKPKYNITEGEEKFYKYNIIDESGSLAYKTTDGKTLTRRTVGNVEGYYYHKKVSDTSYEWEKYTGVLVPVVVEMSENVGVYEQVSIYNGQEPVSTPANSSVVFDEVYGRQISDNPIFGTAKNVYLYNDKPVLEHVSQTTYTGATDVTIGATNATSSDADIKGVTVGLAIASGSNHAETHANNTVLVNVNAGAAHVNNMTIRASNADSVDSYADGNGGGIVEISPMAAAINNNISATTTTNVTGSIIAAGQLDIDALRTNNALLQTNTFSINLVGGSGDHVDNTIKDVVTTVNVKNANLQSKGLIVKAENVTRLNPPDTSAANIDDQKFYNMIMTSAYGGLSYDCGYVDNVVDTVATVNIGDSSNNNTTLLSSKGIEINAHTDNLMNVHSYASGGGVIAGGIIKVDNDITSKDTVNISGANTTIKNTASDKDLVITAADEQQLNSYSYAETNIGIFGATVSKLNNDVNREAKVNVNAGNLYSNKDINYYAGKVADGNLALAVMSLEARDYAGAFIDFVSKPSMDNDFDQKNSVVIGSNVNSYSMKDTNLYASVGRQLVSEKVAMADWIGETKLQNSVVTTEDGDLSKNLTTNNFIEVNGKAIAGIASKIDVYIGGGDSSYLPAITANTTSRGTNNGVNQLVVAGEYLQGAQDYKTYVDTTAEAEERSYEVVGVNDVYVRLDKDPAIDLSLNDFTFGTEDYANALLNRYNALKKLMDEYEQDNQDAYTGYLLERQRIVDILEQENLATVTRNDEGQITKIVINESVNVGYVEVPYISGSGGNINAYADVFKGTGTIEAKGAPEVNIKNNTNLELKLNGIYVGEAGGLITYNGKEISVEGSETAEQKTAAINAAITNANKNKTAAGFASAWAETTLTGGVINVQDVYQEGNVKVTPTTGDTYVGPNIGYLTIDNYELNAQGQYVLKSGLSTYTTDVVAVKPDIYVQANVNNISGNVKIENAQGSIYIQGKNVDDSVGISGNQITLNAPHGSIYQGFTDGIVNIGASPQDQYNAKFEESKAKEQSLSAGNIEIVLTDGTVPTGSWIAGNSVYINAADINVNGVIQSGFGDYYTQIDDKTQANINKVIQNYDGKTQLTDKQVVRGTAYRVIEGGPVWNDQQGCYVYKMSVYYNPSTKKLILEDVDNSGGKIYLSGRISSTNTSGKIICLDGVSDVTINNTLNYDLAVGRVNINEFDGLIRITDTAYAGKAENNKEYLAKITEYTRSGSKSWMLEKGHSDYLGNNLDTAGYTSGTPADNGTYTYVTKSGLYYRWTQGFNFSEIKYYDKDIKTGGWSIKWSSDETKNNLPGYSTNPIKIEDDGETSRPNGEYVGFAYATSAGSSATDPFHIGFTKVPTTDMVYTLDEEKSWKSGLFGYYHHTYKKWHTTQGVRTTFVSTLKADNPINVKFIGQTADNGSISVSSTKNIELNGSLGNNKLYTATVDGNTALNEKGSVYVATTGGSIVQNGGNIYGSDVTLAAAKNIEHINIKAGDDLNFTAVNTVTNVNQVKDATNKIDITVGANGSALANVTTGYLGAVLANTTTDTTTYTSLLNTSVSPTGNAGIVNLTVNSGMRKIGDTVVHGGNIIQAYTQTSQGTTVPAALQTSYNKLSYSNNKLVKTNISLTNGDEPITAADRISLTTSNGAIYGHSIDGGVSPYIVYGGQYANGTDTLSASVSAAAEGNISLSQAKGNMRIGKIYSNKGDVYLYARDGSVDDALPYVETDADTQSQLIKRWMEFGMIEPDAGFTPDETITKAKHVKETVEKNFSLNENFVKTTYPEYRTSMSTIARIESIPEEQRSADDLAALASAKAFVTENGALCQYFEQNFFGYIHDDGTVDTVNYLKDYNATFSGYISDGTLDLAAYLQHTLLKDYTDNIKAQYISLANLKAMPKRTAAQEEQYQYLLKTYGNYADADAFLAHDTGSLRYTERIDADALAVATYQYWNKDALIYSLQNSILNVDPDDRPTTSLKDPNIVGHNINIEVKDAAGFYAIKLDENHKPILDEHGEYIIETKEINVTTLLDRNENGYINPNAIDDLKLLSQADASTVTWEYRSKDGTVKYTKKQFEDNKLKLDSDPTKLEIDRFAIVAKRMPIGVQQNEGTDGKLGTLTVISAATSADTNVSGSIFLEGRDQKPYDGDPNGTGSVVTIEPITENKDLILNRITSNIGSVYISSLGYIFNNDVNYGTASQIINVTGKDIYLLAGGYNYDDPTANSIGTFNRHITTNVLYDAAKPGSGWLAAVAGGGVYIDNISTAGSNTPLKLRNVSSGGDIDIRSDGDIMMQQLQDATEATNYLFTTHDGYITIISRNGSIGTIKGTAAAIDDNTGLEMEGLRLKNHAKDQDPYVQYDDVYTDDNGEHSYIWKTEAEKAAIDGKVTWTTTTDKDGVPVVRGTYVDDKEITHTVTKHDKSLVTLGAKNSIYVEGITTKVDVGLTDPEGKLNLRTINENTDVETRLQNVGITVNGDLNLLNDLDVSNIVSVYSTKEIKWDTNLKLHGDNNLFLGSNTDLKLYNGLLSAGTEAKDGVAHFRAGQDLYFGNPDDEGTMNLPIYGTVEMDAGRDVFLNSDQINVTNVSLVAGRNVLQKYDNTDDSEASAAQSHSLSAARLQATAGGLLDLGSRFNELVNVSVDSKADASHVGRDVVIVGNGNSSRKDSADKARDLSVILQKNLATPVNGNVVIHNYANDTDDAKNKNNITLHITKDTTIANSLTLTNDEQNITIDKDGASGATNLTLGNDLLIRAEEDVLVSSTSVVAGDKVDIKAKNDIANGAQLTTQHGDITMDAGHTILNLGNQHAVEGKITLTSDTGNVNNVGFIRAKEHIGLVSKKGGVWNYIPDHPEQGANYGIVSENSSVSIWAVKDYADTETTASYIGDVRNESSIKAQKNVSIISYNGNVNNKGAIESVDSSVAILAYRNANYRVDTATPVIVGNVTNVDNKIENLHNIKAKSITIGAAYDVTNNGDMVVFGDAGENGSIEISAGSTKYGFDGRKHFVTKDGQLLGFGEIDNSGSFTITNDGSITMTANDDILNTGAMVTDGKGNISLNSQIGSIYNADGADLLVADGDVTLHTNGEATSYYIDCSAEIQTPTPAELATKKVGQCVIIDNRLYACKEVENDQYTQYYDVNGDLKDIPTAGVAYINAEIIRISVDGKGTVSRILYTGGNIINEGDAMALKDSTASNKGNIRIYSEHGSIYNRDDFNTLDKDIQKKQYKDKDISTSDIYIIAPEGYIYNDKDLYSQDDIYIAAKEGLDNFSYNIYAEKDVMLLGTGGVAENLQFGNMTISFKSGEAVDANVVNKSRILSNSGNVTIQSYNGSVSNLDGGDIAAFKGNITLAAAKTVDKDSKKIQFIGIDDTTDPEHPKVYKGYLGAGGTVVTDKDDALEIDSYVRERVPAGDGTYKTVVRYTVNDTEYTYDFSTYDIPNNVVLGDVAVYREGSVVNYGDLIAGSYEVLADGSINSDKKYDGTITLKSTTADVYNYDDFNKITPDSSVIGEQSEIIYNSGKFGSYAVATGDLLFSAVNGLIYNSKKKLVAEGDVTLEAKDALSSFGNDIYAGGNINLIATEGNLVNKAELISIAGDIKLTADKGTVVNLLGADMLALNGDIILTAGAQPEKDADDYSVMQYVDAIGNVGAIDVINAEDKANISSKTLLTDLYYKVDGSGEYKFFSGDPKELADGSLGGLTAAEKATLVSVIKYIDEVEDHVTGKTNFVKEYLGLIQPTESGSEEVIHPYKVYEPGSETVTKTLIPITVVDQEGKVISVNAVSGNVEAFRIGDVINRGDAVALKEPTEGTESKGILLRSEHGNVTNYDNYSYVDGKTKNVNNSIIYQYTGTTSAGGLLFNEHVKLPSGVDPTEMKDYAVGHWDAERNALIAKSSIGLEAPEGYFYSATNIATENNLDLMGKNDLIIGDNVVDIIVGGDLTATSTQGKVGVKDTDLFVGGDVNFIADKGIINTNKSITSVTGHIDLTTNTGAIENTGTDLSAYERVDAYTDNGNINISGNISSGSYTDAHGTTKVNPENNLTHIWTGNGEVDAKDATFTSTGSVDIGSKDGDVNVGSITAKATAAVGSLSGDVAVTTVTADKVILASNDDNGHVNADHINVGTGLIIQADYASLKDIQRIPGSTGMLVMDISGAHGDVMKGDVEITTPGDTRYNTLAVTNAEIKVVDGGRLGVERLHVAGEAHLTAFDFRTAVFGVANEALANDRSPGIYYDLGQGRGSVENLGLEKLFAGRDIKVDPIKGVNDTQLVIDGIDAKINTLSTGADNWQTTGDNDGWMNLYIDDPQNQRSNGLLLHMDHYRYGHHQRYAADTLSRIITDTKAIDAYERVAEPIIPQYFRLDLIKEGLTAEVAEEEHFFTITNANHILGKAINEEDMLGLEKAILGPDRVQQAEDEEKRKKKAK